MSSSDLVIVFMMNRLSWLKKKKLPLLPVPSPAWNTYSRLFAGNKLVSIIPISMWKRSYIFMNSTYWCKVTEIDKSNFWVQSLPFSEWLVVELCDKTLSTRLPTLSLKSLRRTSLQSLAFWISICSRLKIAFPSTIVSLFWCDDTVESLELDRPF